MKILIGVEAWKEEGHQRFLSCDAASGSNVSNFHVQLKSSGLPTGLD